MTVDVRDAAPELEPCPFCGQDHPDTMLKCPLTDLVLPLSGRLLEGKFRFSCTLGTGGMASVWLALNERVDRPVAIKLIRPEVARNEEMVARFRSEARAAGRIGHPHVCEILDSGVGPLGPYIVMEYLRGKNLGQTFKAEGQLRPRRMVGLIRQALAGLAAAHDRGIVHRDLKPENVFLHEPVAGNPIVKLMDFGVAKFIDGSGEATTEHGALLGTPEYMAPEQFKGAAHAELRTDIWAMGAILYRGLSGRHAFRGPTVAATLLMVSQDEPTPLLSLAPDVPLALVEVIDRCLAKDPEERFASARELDEALARFGPASLGPTGDASTDAEPTWPGKHDASADPVLSGLPTVPRPSLGRRSAIALGAWIVMAAVLAAGVVGIYALSNRASDSTMRVSSRGVAPQRRVEVVPPVEAVPTAQVAAEPLADPTHEPAQASPAGSAADLPPVSSRTPPAPPLLDTASVPPTSETGERPALVEDDADTPPGTLRVGDYLVLVRRSSLGDHADARRYCERAAAARESDVAGWSLPNPATAEKIANLAGIEEGRYWTSARHKRRAIVYGVPSGTKDSVKTTSGAYRALCVARLP